MMLREAVLDLKSRNVPAPVQLDVFFKKDNEKKYLLLGDKSFSFYKDDVEREKMPNLDKGIISVEIKIVDNKGKEKVEAVLQGIGTSAEGKEFKIVESCGFLIINDGKVIMNRNINTSTFLFKVKFNFKKLVSILIKKSKGEKINKKVSELKESINEGFEKIGEWEAWEVNAFANQVMSDILKEAKADRILRGDTKFIWKDANVKSWVEMAKKEKLRRENEGDTVERFEYKLPKGGIEVKDIGKTLEETYWNCAVRELKEESCLEIKTEVPRRYKEVNIDGSIHVIFILKDVKLIKVSAQENDTSNVDKTFSFSIDELETKNIPREFKDYINDHLKEE
jgi:hypothetical protein